MRRALAATAVVLALLTATGCTSDGPGKTSVEVDTPELRALKADAGIEDCRPGPGGGGLPDLTLDCLGGGPGINLAALRGPMLINLWYSACEPCRQEMPAFQQFYVDHDRTIPVLGIDVEVRPASAIKFAGEVGATYPQVADPDGSVFDQEGLKLSQAYPQTILIDADGMVAAQQAGEFHSVDEIEDFVAAHVDLS